MSKLFSQGIQRIVVDAYEYIWGINQNNIYICSKEGKVIKHFVADDVLTNSAKLSSIYKDTQNVIWIGTTEEGVFRYNKDNNRFLPIVSSNEKLKQMKYVRCFRDDALGNIWIGTENGLFIYNQVTNNIVHYKADYGRSQFSPADNAIYTIFRSNDRMLWIGSYFGGVNYVMLSPNRFDYIIPGKTRGGLNGKAVSDIKMDCNKNLWLATEDNGITVLQADGNVRYFNKQMTPGLKGNNIHSLAEDKEGNFWVGAFIDGLHYINLKTNQIESFKNDIGVLSNSIYKILVLNTDSLIVGTEKGVELFHIRTREFSRLNSSKIPQVRVEEILKDKKKLLWFGTRFNGIYSYNMETHKAKHYTKDCSKSIISDDIISGLIDSKGRIWFGTSDGGLMLYDELKDDFVVYGDIENVLYRDIYAIEEDGRGTLWLSTDQGIFNYDSKTERFTKYYIEDQFISNQFNSGASYKDKEGIIYFGSINGVCYFHPEEVANRSLNYSNLKIIFSDFKVANTSLHPKSGGIINRSINYVDEIKLKSHMNTISLSFLCINYNYSAKNDLRLEYFMEGLDTEWNCVNRLSSTIAYNNLSSDSYMFTVRLCTKNGEVIDQRRIKIVVSPHFMLTPLMKTMYALLVIVILFIILRFYKMRLKDRMEVQIERIEKQKIQELNQHKLTFFTYITHEFKTPLSILTAIFDDQCFDKERYITEVETSIVKRNVQRLQFLINQLMEFRTVESDHANIKNSKGDVMKYIRAIADLFLPIVNKKGIIFTCVTEPFSWITVFDNDKIEKIVSNLLSNAIKYSVSGSAISLKVSQNGRNMVIECYNSYSYIPLEQQKNVFLPYQKAESMGEKYSNTGIGLALVNSLVQLLHGNIELISSPQSGTTFIVSIPIAERQLNDATVMNENKIINSQDVIADTLYFVEDSLLEGIGNKVGSGKYMVLFVEDNKDMAILAKSKLLENYKVRLAFDGKEAIKILNEETVDVIVSDVMMPYVNGYELCQYVKNKKEYSHIPIILLTVQDDKDSEIRGFKSGADSYLKKPFNFFELDLRIRNLIHAKESIKEYYHEVGVMETYQMLNNKDEKFIQELRTFIIANLQDDNLDSNKIAEYMGVGRTQLYNKLKKTMDMSISEFVNKVKIDLAKQKLCETNLTLSEIAYQLGFSTPSYFSKVFRKYVGITPNEFKRGDGISGIS